MIPTPASSSNAMSASIFSASRCILGNLSSKKCAISPSSLATSWYSGFWQVSPIAFRCCLTAVSLTATPNLSRNRAAKIGQVHKCVIAEVGWGAVQYHLFHPVLDRLSDDGVGAARHMAFQRLKPAPVVLFQPAVNARTVKIIGFGHLFRALAQHADGVHRHPPYVVHDIIGYLSLIHISEPTRRTPISYA